MPPTAGMMGTEDKSRRTVVVLDLFRNVHLIIPAVVIFSHQAFFLLLQLLLCSAHGNVEHCTNVCNSEFLRLVSQCLRSLPRATLPAVEMRLIWQSVFVTHKLFCLRESVILLFENWLPH